MRVEISGALLAAATLIGLPLPAAPAEEGPGAIYSQDDYPVEQVSRPLTLSKGMMEVDVLTHVNLSPGQVGKPVSIPFVVSGGVTEDLQVDVYSVTGLCLTGTSNGCPKLFDDLGARWILSLDRGSGYQIAGVVGLDSAKLSTPSLVQAQLGLEVKGAAGPLALTGAGVLFVGLNNRNLGNEEFVGAALELQVQLVANLALAATTGFAGRVSDFSSSYVVPLTLSAIAVPVRNVDVGAEFTFRNLREGKSTSDARQGGVLAAIRF